MYKAILRRRLLAPVAVALLVTLLRADSKPNSHHNNDRKLVGGRQGLECCVLFVPGPCGNVVAVGNEKSKSATSKPEPFTHRGVRDTNG